jgi:hypothetical protein
MSRQDQETASLIEQSSANDLRTMLRGAALILGGSTTIQKVRDVAIQRIEENPSLIQDADAALFKYSKYVLGVEDGKSS